jgi:hypothetical protein
MRRDWRDGLLDRCVRLLHIIEIHIGPESGRLGTQEGSLPGSLDDTPRGAGTRPRTPSNVLAFFLGKPPLRRPIGRGLMPPVRPKYSLIALFCVPSFRAMRLQGTPALYFFGTVAFVGLPGRCQEGESGAF